MQNSENGADKSKPSGRTDEAYFRLLDKAADDRSGLSAEERILLVSFMEEDARNGRSAYDRWFDSRQKRPFSPDTPEYDREAVEQVIRQTVDWMNADRRRNRIRRIFLAAGRVAAMLAFAAVSIIVYEQFRSGAKSEEDRILVPEMENARREMHNLLARRTVQTYFSPKGSRSKVVLGDSTTVWLNSDSKLVVNSDYGDSLRMVVLEGHALFEVRKNKKVPFYVIVGDKMSIKVTGTRFSVHAYSGDDYIETVLVDGQIDVVSKGRSVKMAPSDRLLLENASDRMSLSKIAKEEKYVAWTDGILIFEDAPMSEVVTSLEKWFNVNIRVENPAVLEYRITAKLDNLSLEQVMNNLSYISNMEYAIEKRDVLLK